MFEDRWLGLKEITKHLGTSRETVAEILKVDAWVKSDMVADSEAGKEDA